MIIVDTLYEILNIYFVYSKKYCKKESQMKTISRSVKLMFLFDFITLCLSTCLWANYFDYTKKAICILWFLVLTVGLAVLF